MFSLNAPVPGDLKRFASDLAPALLAFDSVRERHALVLKRFEEGSIDRIRAETRRVLDGEPPVEARATGIGVFSDPLTPPGPVVYLAIESPGLRRLHGLLVETFGAVEGFEGDDYVPHVTLARGGSAEAAERLRDRSVDPIAWTVRELRFWDARGRESVGRVSLSG